MKRLQGRYLFLVGIIVLLISFMRFPGGVVVSSAQPILQASSNVVRHYSEFNNNKETFIAENPSTKRVLPLDQLASTQLTLSLPDKSLFLLENGKSILLRSGVTSARFLPDGRIAAILDDLSLVILDSYKVIELLPRASANGPLFISPDGTRIAYLKPMDFEGGMTPYTNGVAVFNLETKEETILFAVPYVTVNLYAWLQDSLVIDVPYWDKATLEPSPYMFLGTISSDNPSTSVAFLAQLPRIHSASFYPSTSFDQRWLTYKSQKSEIVLVDLIAGRYAIGLTEVPESSDLENELMSGLLGGIRFEPFVQNKPWTPLPAVQFSQSTRDANISAPLTTAQILFFRPAKDSISVSAYKDLDTRAVYIRDWTGWTGTEWKYGHAYDGHEGTDYDGLNQAPWTPVYPAQTGTVSALSISCTNTYPNASYGTNFRIEHGTLADGSNYSTGYAHLRCETVGVQVNQSITILSQQIGEQGRTGNATAEHLHLNVRRNGTLVDPYELGIIGGAYDGGGGGPCSSPPPLVSPDDGATVNNKTVKLDWNAPNCSGVTGYTLHITTGSGPEDGIIKDTGVGETEYTWTFPDYKTYYWHIAAWSNGQRGPWASRKIVIGSAPPVKWTYDVYDTTQRWDDITWSGIKLCGDMKLDDDNLDEDYGQGGPCSGMVGDTWVADYSRTVNLNGRYIFYARHDDMARVWVNGQKVYDRAEKGEGWSCDNIVDLNGNTSLRVMLREDSGGANIYVKWSTDTSVCPPADNTPPTVEWREPSGDTGTTNVYGQEVRLRVDATDNKGVSRVVFQRWDAVNNKTVEIGQVTSSPYQLQLNTSTLNPSWNEVQAYAYDAAGNSSYKYVWVVLDPPAAPTLNPIPNDDKDGNYTVSWSKPTGATSFELQEQLGSGSWTTVYSGADTSKAFSNMANGTWQYRVQAKGAGGTGDWSNIEKTTVGPTPDTIPPKATQFIVELDSTDNRIVNISASGVSDNSGGSGVKWVRFSAKVNGQWGWIATLFGPPFSLSWNMCTNNVPKGDVEFGLEVQDNAGNSWNWSDKYSNRHIDMNADCSPPKPDLVPFAPSGYQYPVVPTSIKGTKTSGPLFAGKPLFLDWYFKNIGNGPATGNFKVRVTIDNTTYVDYPFSNYNAGTVDGFDDWYIETHPKVGCQIVKMVVDPDNTIAESNENNNTWQGEFCWQTVNGWWAEFFNNTTLSGDPVLVRDDTAINFEWQANSPGPGVNADNFSARWTRTVSFDSWGNYRFDFTRDDGLRFYVDGQKIVDRWYYGAETFSMVHVVQSAGSYPLKLEMYDSGGYAAAKVSWILLPPEKPVIAPISNGDGDGNFSVSWNKVLGTHEFQLEEQKDGGSWAIISPWRSVIFTGFQRENLQSGTWCYRVQARNTSGTSPKSEVVCTTVNQSLNAPIIIAPSYGTTFVEGEAITLSWQSVATATGYYGEITGGPGDMTFGWQSGTSVNIGAQWPGYEYYWRVKARNGGGEGGYTDKWLFTVIPKAPSGLSAKPLTCATINLNWEDNSGSEDSIVVYRNGKEIKTFPDNTVGYTDYGLEENTTYTYKVRASKNGIFSGESNTVSAKTLKCDNDTTAPQVTWVEPVGNEGVYNVSGKNVTLKVNAIDNVGVASVRFWRWDHPTQQEIELGIDSQTPYTALVDTSKFTNDWNQIFAQATDNAGNMSEISFIWLYDAPMEAPVFYGIDNPAQQGSYWVSWSIVDSATSYELQENHNGGAYHEISNTSYSSRYISDRSEGVWCYRVRATNADVVSDWSGIQCTTAGGSGGEYRFFVPMVTGR